MDQQEVLATLAQSTAIGRDFREEVVQLLAKLPDYGWSGFYALEGDMLVLDAYVGAPTEHSRIPVGRGVCGTAVAEDRNVVVDDVTQLDNYLACSLETKSEIVVLVRRGDEVLGQIDIDGHRVGAFGPRDEAFLTQVAQLAAERW